MNGRWSGLSGRLIAGLLATAACSEVDRGETATAVDLPAPSLEVMAPATQERLGQARRQIELRLRQLDGQPDGALAKQIGELGVLYQAYGLLQPAEQCYRLALAYGEETFRWAYLLGYVSQTRGLLDAAAEAFTQAVAHRPNDLPAWVRLGLVRLRQNQDSAARVAFSRALELDPDCALALRGLGELDLRRDDAGQALRRFTRALEIQPKATSLHHLAAMAAAELGRSELARRHFAAYGTVPVALDDPLIEEVQRTATGAAAELLRGHSMLAAGRIAEAIDYYRRAVELNPTEPAGRRALAQALAETGRHASALTEIEILIDSGQATAPIHFLAGRLYALDADEEAALAAYERAVAIDPQYVDAWFNRANTLARLGRFAAAASAYDRVLELARDDTDALARKAQCLAYAGRPAEVRETINRLRQLDPVRAAALEGQLAVAAGGDGSAFSGHP